MLRWLLLGIACASLSACITAGDSFTAPSGATANTARCSYSPNGCFKQASQTCGGPYLVLDSESHAGGALADALPGPVTWYAMTYQCSPSDGKMPAFPFKGLPTVNANVNENITIQQR
jgi:hypothetical protein